MIRRLIDRIFNFTFRSDKKAQPAKNLRDAALDLGLWSSTIMQTNCFRYQTWRGLARKMTRPTSLICRQVYPEDICSFSSGCKVFFFASNHDICQHCYIIPVPSGSCSCQRLCLFNTQRYHRSANIELSQSTEVHEGSRHEFEGPSGIFVQSLLLLFHERYVQGCGSVRQ